MGLKSYLEGEKLANSLSGKLAIEHGFEEIPDKDAYLGFVYIKDEKNGFTRLML